jgi:uncharacterized damage-inducible protein DinB
MRFLRIRYFGILLAAVLVAGSAAPRAMAQSAPAADPGSGEFQAAMLSGMQVMGKRAVAMANGIPADAYTWAPGNNGRTIANLFLHLAFSLWTRPRAFGAAPADGFDASQKADAYENSTTDKAKVVEQLSKAFQYAEDAVQNLSDADLQKHVKAAGRDSTVETVIALWQADNSEHIGQLMVYSRLHGFAPPTPGDVAKQSAAQ